MPARCRVLQQGVSEHRSHEEALARSTPVVSSRQKRPSQSSVQAANTGSQLGGVLCRAVSAVIRPGHRLAVF
jgi:hypothetical protein